MIRTNQNGTELRIPRLVYTTDEQPGISRVKRGRGFQYLLPDKSHLKDRVELARIRKLGVPPAYTDVWICHLTSLIQPQSTSELLNEISLGPRVM